ncbi:MAG: CopG family antitoxin [Lamprobacter sp.]|uniref:CopG family antitoxin n=1 Tax=Lamprobacter sp. TaxID=3100796 RepID=UPI002B256981|nr:CopG family antitoxin [Lamprobacter sp.]MEA3639752.1 CopG family antitoxin [Lamprobacter sp.]
MGNRSSVSQGTSYREIGEFWDKHDATEHGADNAAELELELTSQRHYVAVDRNLCSRIRSLANQRGVSEETLLNLFLKERLDQCEQEQSAISDAHSAAQGHPGQ